MKASIIINTLNRGHTLENTIKSLFYLDYKYDYEVIIVDGNSTDNTAEILDKYKQCIKIGNCKFANLSMSRNIGIAMADSNYIAFIDDDAIPEPEWLTNIMRKFDREDVAAVGGPVYDNYGINFQKKRFIFNRFSNDYQKSKLPVHSFPHSFEFYGVIGCNSIFRKDYVLKVGGFNEQYDYFLDETELCSRLIDYGYRIEYSENAFVHHKYSTSAIRNNKKVFLDYSKIIKNEIYFIKTYKNIIDNEELINKTIEEKIKGVYDLNKYYFRENIINETEYNNAIKSIEKGIEEGFKDCKRGYHLFIKEETLYNNKSSFKKFTPYLEKEKRLNICYLTNEYYPDIRGGIGKFVYILAREVAKLGHQVHVITLTRNNIESVNFEENVWVHRIGVNKYPKSLLEYDTVNDNFNWNRMNTLYSHYEEILKINKKCKVDIVQTPIWDSLGFYALFDTRFNLVTTLHTSMKTIFEGIYYINEEVEFHIEIEEYLLNKIKFIVSNSNAIEKQYNQYYNDACKGKTFLIPHGFEDISKLAKYNNKKLSDNSDNIEVLFVGRLEHRKGIDIIFECIPYICQKYNNVIFRFCGDDSINMPNSEKTYKDYFLSKYNEFNDKVIFEGYISDDEIIDRYSNCDIFIAPSRFESFGLIFLEAMIFSKPVIGTNIGGIPEVVADGVSGILIENENSEDLKNGLIKLIENKDIRESMGKNGRRIYEEKFTAEIMANKFIDYYKNILKCGS